MTRALLALALVCLIAPATAGAAERAVAWKTTDDDLVPRHDAAVLPISVFVDDCGANADQQRIEVERTEDTVTVTVFDEEPEAEVCPAIAKEVQLNAHLDGPLGTRAIIDGSDDRTVFTGEQPLRWALAGKAMPSPSARRLAIAYRRCAGSVDATRAVVTRTKAAVTITVLRRARAGAGRCDRTRVTENVRLRGPLGRRAIRDGGSSPPRIVLAGP